MKRTHPLTSLVVVLSSTLHAADIQWVTSPFEVSGPQGKEAASGNFKKDGILTLAQNLGGKALTYDGIPFDEGTITLGDSFDAYHIPTEESVIKTGTWNDDKVPATITLDGLTIGARYRIQAVIYDGRALPTIIGKTVEFDGKKADIYANSNPDISWGNGILATGTFTADKKSQSFTVETFAPPAVVDNSSTTPPSMQMKDFPVGSCGGQLNALVLHKLTSTPAIAKKPVKTKKSHSQATLISIGNIAINLKE